MAASEPASGAAGAVEGAASLYHKEGEAAFKAQLASGQVAAARINKRLRSVRIRLKNGGRVLFRYPAKQGRRVRAELAGKGVPVKVLEKAEAVAEQKAKPHHHKLRYIVGGAALVVLVIIGVLFYLWRRRRKRARAAREPAIASEHA